MTQEVTTVKTTRNPMELASELTMIGDFLLVQRDEAEKMAGKFYIPESAQIVPHAGKVLALGPGRMLECGKYSPMPFEVGQTVIFPMHCGVQVQELGSIERLVVLRSEEILAVWQRERSNGND